MSKGMRIILIEDTMCAGDRHEIMNYPRDGFVPKPTLPKGTILTVKERWHNFYGYYFRCYHKNGEYDIPKRNARPYISEVWVVSWPIGRPSKPIRVSEKFYSEDEARKFVEGIKQEMRKVGAFTEAEKVQVYKEL